MFLESLDERFRAESFRDSLSAKDHGEINAKKHDRGVNGSFQGWSDSKPLQHH